MILCPLHDRFRFTAAGLRQPDISILSDKFLAEVKDLPHCNLAIELLRKPLNEDIRLRSRRNAVQARSFREMLELAMRAYHNRAIEAAQVIAALIELAREMREADPRGEKLGLTEAEVPFYDALETSDSAAQVLGDETLRTIARELAETTDRWSLRADLHRRLAAPGHPERDRRLDWEAPKTRVLSVLKQRAERNEPGLSNADIRQITHLDRYQAARLMRELIQENTRVQAPTRGRGARYTYQA